ncbi:MAG: ATP-dependent zinc metalloprotease FtsH [Opitutales bacterium]|nr:ATP-dependent zinc metalloprotease FtsH [Opitutales bacterium]
MSDNSPNRNKPLKSIGDPEKMQQPKVWFIWLAIGAAMIFLFLLTNPNQEEPLKWTIQQVVDNAADGQVVSGIIKTDSTGGRNWTIIRGKLKEEYAIGGKTHFEAEGRLTESRLETLQKMNVFKEEPESTATRDFLYTLLPLVLVVAVLYFLFVRQLRMAGKGAMSFGKSRAKMLTRDREKVTFKDVAGCEEAKEEIKEVVDFLKDPKKFQKIGGRIPKGCLLVGPPGTGKTLIARAVAGEADVPFFSISGSDFVEMFVGVGAARVRDMFEQGRKNAPCIVFIDEIDAVGRQRGAGLGGGNDEREQTLNSLLVEMDGFDGHEGVIIMAATNRPDVLDSALLRPGRFDRQVIIDLPDIKGREEILKVHAKKIRLSEKVDLRVIAGNTSGFAGADLANLLNEGALHAARYGKEEVEMIDIEEARDKISFGRERRTIMDDEDRKIIAYHEAGHAVLGAVLRNPKLPIHKVTIIPRGRALGMAMYTPKKDIILETKKCMLDNICMTMGGRVAEELMFGDVTNGASGDIEQATRTARRMVCEFGMSDLGMIALGTNKDHIFLGREYAREQNFSEETARKVDAEISRIIDAEYKRAYEIITENRKEWVNIAEMLLEHETIEGKHVYEILEHGHAVSAIVKQRSPKDVAEETEGEPEQADSDLSPDKDNAAVETPAAVDEAVLPSEPKNDAGKPDPVG